MEDKENILKELYDLEKEHNQVDGKLEELIALNTLDQLLIQRHKKRKLWLKDRIRYLRSILYPDVIA
ncbi:YdcH family protein [Rickettsiales endosymbiont of Stachyamoeba lipophora]|uniref:YdcH family protein n=1 Tax=Rickettsiales endosymbiont of Stachyamoeba lipophora TaxID=2486578 RepID=UPI000F646296|nr:DUF465 domain-containing protein [Rickettsiales endosymbiont of Stachyamoeba lipophora]AZL16275.1 DUF465 domain-containing protein [Rickettsiales endosymbiont of Stachyamoeba lipophora]